MQYHSMVLQTCTSSTHLSINAKLRKFMQYKPKRNLIAVMSGLVECVKWFHTNGGKQNNSYKTCSLINVFNKLF